jgi:hypothetical protein
MSFGLLRRGVKLYVSSIDGRLNASDDHATSTTAAPTSTRPPAMLAMGQPFRRSPPLRQRTQGT